MSWSEPIDVLIVSRQWLEVVTDDAFPYQVELIRQPHQVISLDAVRALYRVASVDRYMSLAVDASVPKTVVEILSNSAKATDNRTVCDGLLLLGNMAFNAEARSAIGDNNGVKVRTSSFSQRKLTRMTESTTGLR